MEDFLVLSSQIFLIICIQSILEVMAYSRRENFLSKPITLGGYITSLILVLRFVEGYIAEILQSIEKLF